MNKKSSLRIGFLFLLLVGVLTSCTRAKLNRAMRASKLDQVHAGVAIADLETGKLLFEKQSNRFFMPASNMKLFTFWQANRVLKDKTPSYFYQETQDSLFIWGAGDPSLLHPDFGNTQLTDFLKSKNKVLVYAEDQGPKPMGSGWAWDDYTDYYSAEISALPMYGNVVNFKKDGKSWKIFPEFFQKTTQIGDGKLASRERNTNEFHLNSSLKDFQGPFITSPKLTAELLADAIKKPVISQKRARTTEANLVLVTPLDSLLKPMMYFSDNMIAEQFILQMAAAKNKILDTEPMIESLQKEANEDFLKQVKWVDGSGLSRYNLVRPMDLISVIQGIYHEMSAERWQSLLPEAGKSGTLKNIKLTNPKLRMWAKSGSFSNTYNLSGIVITPKGKKFGFSVMTNLANQPVSVSKAAVVQFLNQLSAF